MRRSVFRGALVVIVTGAMLMTLSSSSERAVAEEAADAPPNAHIKTCILPMGKHDRKLLRASAKGVTYLYGFDVKVMKPVPMPKEVYYPKRKRWRADQILDWLDANVYPDSGCTMVLGFTRQDISVTAHGKEDWGVLGYAQVEGRVGVVSSLRTWRGLKPPHTKLRRTVKVFNHEVGHILGIPHVPGAECLMSDAEGSVLSTDQQSGLLCASTKRWMERNLGAKLPDHDNFDWSQVE